MADAVGIAIKKIPQSSGGTLDFIDAELGLTPNAAYFLVFNAASAFGDVASPNMRFGIGATDGTREWSVAVSDVDNLSVSSNTSRFLGSTSCATRISGSSVNGQLGFNSFIENGVRCDVDDAAADDQTYVIAIMFNAVNAYAGLTDVGTVNVATDVTAPGFGDTTDKVMAFFADNGATVASGFTAHGILGFGMAANLTAGVAQAGLGWHSTSSAATSAVNGKLITDGVGMQMFNGAFNWSVEISDFDSSGFTQTARDGSGGSDDLCYLLLEFENDVWVGQYDAPTTTGDDDLTDMGWPCALVIEVMTMHDTVDSFETGALGGAFGLAVYTPHRQYCIALATEDGQTTTDTQTIMDSQAIRLTSDAGVATFAGAFTGNLSNGVQRNFSDADATARKWFGMALRAPSSSSGGASGNMRGGFQ